MFILALLYLAGLMNETISGTGNLIEITSPNDRIVVKEGSTAETIWNIKTTNISFLQFTKIFQLCLKTLSGKIVLKTIPGQILTLPMMGQFRNISFSIRENSSPGRKRYEVKLSLYNVQVGDHGDFELSVKSTLGMFEKSMSISLIVVRMPKLSAPKKALIVGKGEKVALRWIQILEGDVNMYFRMNKELHVIISKRDRKNGSNRRIVLFEKSPMLTRLPPRPEKGVPETMRKRMRSVSSFVIKHRHGKIIFKNKIGLKIKELTTNDSGVYTLELILPSGLGIAQDIHLEVLDCLGNSCYRFHKKIVGNWRQNRQKCQNESGDLVRMETRNEWEFVKDVLKTKANMSMHSVSNQESSWHIGLKKEGIKWIWVDTGTQVNNSDSRWAYGKDGPLSNSNAKCAVIFTGSNGELKNSPCSSRGRFICEISKKN